MDRSSLSKTLVGVPLLALAGMLACSRPPAAHAKPRRATPPERGAVASASFVLLDAYRDPRIERNAIPEQAGDGLTDADVLILWRGAKFLLEQGRCARVDYANRSFVDASRYFVQDALHSVYFTEADLPR